LIFAGKVGLYLSVCSTLFLIHSILPFVKIPKPFNLSEINENIKKWSNYAESRVSK